MLKAIMSCYLLADSAKTVHDYEGSVENRGFLLAQ